MTHISPYPASEPLFQLLVHDFSASRRSWGYTNEIPQGGKKGHPEWLRASRKEGSVCFYFTLWDDSEKRGDKEVKEVSPFTSSHPPTWETCLGVWVRWSLAELLSVPRAVMENYIHSVHTFIGLCLLGIVQQAEQDARPNSTPQRQPVPLTLSATGNIRHFVAVKLSMSVLLSTQPSLDMLLRVSIAHLPGECWGCYM